MEYIQNKGQQIYGVMTSDTDAFALARLSFKLKRLEHRLTVALTPAIPYRLTARQFQHLLLIAHCDGITLAELGALSGVGVSTASAVIGQLTVRKLVTRRDDLTDRRRTIFAATQKALPLIERLWPELCAAQECVLAPLTQSDRDALLRLLRHLDIEPQETHALGQSTIISMRGFLDAFLASPLFPLRRVLQRIEVQLDEGVAECVSLLQVMLLEVLAHTKALDTKGLASFIGLDQQNIYTHLSGLTKAGLIKKSIALSYEVTAAGKEMLSLAGVNLTLAEQAVLKNAVEQSDSLASLIAKLDTERYKKITPPSNLSTGSRGKASGVRGAMRQMTPIDPPANMPALAYLYSRLPYLLLRCGQVANAVFSQKLGGKDLTLQQFQYWKILEAAGPLSQVDIARRMGNDNATAGAVLANLMSKGLVSRQVDGADGRRKVVIATRGHSMVEAAIDAECATEHAFESAADGQLAMLHHSLLHMALAQSSSPAWDAGDVPLNMIPTTMLLRRCVQLSEAKMARTLAPYGLTVRQYAALWMLAFHPACTTAALCRLMGFEASTVRLVLSSLAASGLIRSNQGAEGRVVYTASTNGFASIMTLEATLAAVDATLVEDGVKDEADALRTTLARIAVIHEPDMRWHMPMLKDAMYHSGLLSYPQI